jgi:hypothetical protein
MASIKIGIEIDGESQSHIIIDCNEGDDKEEGGHSS